MTAQTLDRDREIHLADEAGEARWLAVTLAALDFEAGPPPF